MKVLIVYFEYPAFDTHSGALRLFELTKALRDAGHDVAFWSHQQSDAKYRAALESYGVKCFDGSPDAADGTLGLLHGFLTVFQPDVAVLSHHFVFSSSIATIRGMAPACHCILDTVDLHYVRERRAAELSGLESDRAAAEATFAAEWTALNAADSVWVVSDTERSQLRHDSLEPGKRVFVIGNVHVPKKETPDLEARDGIVYLGGYRFAPNVDAVDYFMEQIFPLVRAERKDIRFTIAGSHPPASFEKYAALEGVTVTGFVDDMQAVLEAHRASIAPLRYGAGVKGKIGEYLSTGTPCVTTSVGAEGMGLVAGKEVLVADTPEDFAAAILQVYDNKSLWQDLSLNGKKYVERVLSPVSVKPELSNSIEHARARPVRKRPRAASLAWKILNPFACFRLAHSAYQSFRSGGLHEFQLRYKRWMAKG